METFRDAQSLHKLTTQVGMERSRFSVSNSEIGEELASEIKGKDNPQNQAKRHAQNEWIQAINRACSTCSLTVPTTARALR